MSSSQNNNAEYKDDKKNNKDTIKDNNNNTENKNNTDKETVNKINNNSNEKESIQFLNIFIRIRILSHSILFFFLVGVLKIQILAWKLVTKDDEGVLYLEKNREQQHVFADNVAQFEDNTEYFAFSGVQYYWKFQDPEQKSMFPDLEKLKDHIFMKRTTWDQSIDSSIRKREDSFDKSYETSFKIKSKEDFFATLNKIQLPNIQENTNVENTTKPQIAEDISNPKKDQSCESTTRNQPPQNENFDEKSQKKKDKKAEMLQFFNELYETKKQEEKSESSKELEKKLENAAHDVQKWKNIAIKMNGFFENLIQTIGEKDQPFQELKKEMAEGQKKDQNAFNSEKLNNECLFRFVLEKGTFQIRFWAFLYSKKWQGKYISGNKKANCKGLKKEKAPPNMIKKQEDFSKEEKAELIEFVSSNGKKEKGLSGYLWLANSNWSIWESEYGLISFFFINQY